VLKYVNYLLGFLMTPKSREEINGCLDNMSEEKIAYVLQFVKNILRGRAGATGSGIFVLPQLNNTFLLRQRIEKGSLFGEDLSGKWEAIGGGLEIWDFNQSWLGVSEYQTAIIKRARYELNEEAGLDLWEQHNHPVLDVNLIPAWLMKDGIIDLAFIMVVPFGPPGHISTSNHPFLVKVQNYDLFQDLLDREYLKFFSPEEVSRLNIVSPRMRYMIESGIRATQKISKER
jgi:hypothetical protein